MSIECLINLVQCFRCSYIIDNTDCGSGGAATYARLNPNIKKRYDYGVMIFILTFNLVSVSGLREENVIEIARERLVMIVLGFAICICISLFVFPMWASDELHDSMVSKFEGLASSIEGRQYMFKIKNQLRTTLIKLTVCEKYKFSECIFYILSFLTVRTRKE